MSNIKILARIKPMLKKNTKSCLENQENNILIKKLQKGCRKDHLVNYKYAFDRVFDHETSNIDLYNGISIDILRYMFKYKKDVTFYVYGQTGSGKTHTILGNEQEEGFFTLILNDMLEINQKEGVKINVLEIYNNKCYDLLDNHKLVFQRENAKNEYVFSSSKKILLSSAYDVLELKKDIITKRNTGISGENESSSRSHLLINVYFANKNLKLLDLAGCEKAKKAVCDSRTKYKENGEINQSLFVLKECIRSLLKQNSYIPFRRNELTKILKHSFQDSCKTFILATLSQDVNHWHTTSDVLNYISEIKNIKSLAKREELPPINNDFINMNVVGSPRYKFIYSNKQLFHSLLYMENQILTDMYHKKTTKHLFEDYSEIVDKKKKLLQAYSENVKPCPPLLPKPTNILPIRNRKYK
tara:strand:+ start:64 stop:1305 length:1242 start_codon:yes stop_codon:yes gene_type:complete